MSEFPNNQEEHEQISTSLDVEMIDPNLYRSVRLWKPPRARGVFGGQVISQACVSATNCVDPAFGLHSLHCYFLASADPQVPILYFIEKLRKGRSYTTCSVKAVQNGQMVFMMLCSFQKPEPWQPVYQLSMPEDVPAPEKCELEEDRYRRNAAASSNEEVREMFMSFAEERSKSPIAVKMAKKTVIGDAETYMFWMRARNIPKYDVSYQKCILGYISDLQFINTAPRVLGLKFYSSGPDAVSMTSTVDHSIYFYETDFNCGDWLLYVITCPRAGSGRAVVQGRMYNEAGKLIAVMTQEGVVRADRRPPAKL